MGEQELSRSLGKLEQLVVDMQAHLERHIGEEKDDISILRQKLESLNDSILLLRTEHVIVRASASTVVKVVLWLAAVISGLAAAWDWIRQHLNFQ